MLVYCSIYLLFPQYYHLFIY